MPSALLFDLDGTLTDTITLYERAVLQTFQNIGIPMTQEQFADDYWSARHLRELLRRYGIPLEREAELRAQRDEIYTSLLRKEVEWFPGALDLLTSLRDRGMPMALVTGSWMTYVDAIDSRLHVKQFFPAIITADEIHKFMKPHPHGLLLAADRLGVDPKECIYLGDQQFDIDAAHAAGMESWLVRGKWTPGRVTGAKRVLTSLDEILI